MSKLTVFCLLLGAMSFLLTQQAVEARPFFFNIFTPTRSSNTVRTETQTTNNFPFGDLISAKLRLLTTLLQGGVSGGVGFGFNKFGAPSTTTTTSKPSYSTEVNTVYVPETTKKINTVIAATEEIATGLIPLTNTKKPDVAISVDIDADHASESSTKNSVLEIVQQGSDKFTTSKTDINVAIDADLASESSTESTALEITNQGSNKFTTSKADVAFNVNIDADLASQSSTEATAIEITNQGSNKFTTSKADVAINVNIDADLASEQTTKGFVQQITQQNIDKFTTSKIDVNVDFEVEATTKNYVYETTQSKFEKFTTSKANTGYVYTTKKPGYEYTTRHSVTPGYVYSAPDSANDVYNPFLPPY